MPRHISASTARRTVDTPSDDAVPAERPLPPMLNKEDLATFLAMSTKVLSNWRWRGSGPRWVKVGRLVRYRREDVLAWIESNRSPAGRDVA